MSRAYKMADPDGCLTHRLHSDGYRKAGAGGVIEHRSCKLR
jgi:hypothetical protein